MTAEFTHGKISQKSISEFRGKVLKWYDKHRRMLPWRVENPDPYKVWLSEIMLQQTVVNTVIPYYEKFLQIWPDIESLASAKQEDVLREWAGLGYYSRARNLHKCAQAVVNNHDGRFPQSLKELKALPGIGDYTGSAIMAIAFNRSATVMDGNIERIMARVFAVTDELPGVKKNLKTCTQLFFNKDNRRPGDFAQALMDIGAGICIAKKPRCFMCPVSDLCQGYRQNIADTLPRKKAKKQTPQKFGRAYLVSDGNGRILLERREEKGMLAGMTGFPTSDWIKGKGRIAEPDFIMHGRLNSRKNLVFHVFTHFKLELEVVKASLKAGSKIPENFFWVQKSQLYQQAFPSLFQKVMKFVE